jgi:anti-sigma regulatory factor (Ser/Thr protein kinase)
LTVAAESGVDCAGRRPRPVKPAAGARPGRAGALMAGVVARESVTVAGLAERARVARVFVAGVLGPGHPCGDDAVLLVSELFSNSVRHGGPGDPGAMVTVAVGVAGGVVRVEVAGRSGPGVPELRPAGQDAEGGRGLGLVAGLASRWGWDRHGGRTVTWFECALEAPDCIPGSAGRDLEDIPGSMAYPELKGDGDSSMPLKRRSFPGIRDGVPQGPRDMVKAKLPEP